VAKDVKEDDADYRADERNQLTKRNKQLGMERQEGGDQIKHPQRKKGR